MKKLAFLVAAAMALTCVSETQAAPILMLSDGVTTVTIDDQEADGGGDDDLNPVVEAVTWVGTIGVFIVNVSTGISDGVLGINTMDLNSVNTSVAAGTMTIKFTDDGFSGPGYVLDIGGTTEGTITAEVWTGADGTAFDLGTLVTSFGPYSTPPIAFSGSSSGAAGSSPHQLTLVAIISHGSGVNATSFDAQVTPLPEPTSLALLGMGVVGLMGYARRRKAA